MLVCRSVTGTCTTTAGGLSAIRVRWLGRVLICVYKSDFLQPEDYLDPSQDVACQRFVSSSLLVLLVLN